MSDEPAVERTTPAAADPHPETDGIGRSVERRRSASGSALSIAWPTIRSLAEHRMLKEILRAQLFDQPAGGRVGRYTIRRQLGMGGMGVVYAAHDEELDREVAIKLLLSSNRSDEARERLLGEARALARLSHPNVVQVYEVDRTGEQVFIAMELVAGHTLREWQQGEDRPWREILAMYVQAGRGLAAAHERGIVHRDFKPDNVLVGEDGRARVGDFGLALAHVHPVSSAESESDADADADADADVQAKADADVQAKADADADADAESLPLLGTIAYMAPEQFCGDPTSTRSDQFSFCVSLYEALYGQRPFAGDDAVSVAEAVVAGAIEPPPPRRRALPGWLDRVLRRGLSRHPDERFASMDELLTRVDRAGRRKKLVAVGIAALLVGVGGGLAVGVPLATPDRDEPCRVVGAELDGAWNPTRKEAIAANFVGSGLAYAHASWAGARSALDAYADEWARTRHRACLATMVERRQSDEAYDLQMACLDRRTLEFTALVDQFAARDNSGRPDPVVVENAVEAAASLPAIEPCRDSASLRLGAQPPEPGVANAVDALRRRVVRAATLRRAGKVRDGSAEAREAVADARAVGYPPILAEALYELGGLQTELGLGEDAIASLLEAVDIAEASRHDELAVRVWLRLAEVAVLRKKSAVRGHEWSRRARAAIARIQRGDDDVYPLYRAEALHDEGDAFRLERDLVQAEARFRDALAIRERGLGADHVSVARARESLANVLALQARPSEALELYEQALAGYVALQGDDHPEVARAHFNLAMVLVDAGELSRARVHHERALAGYRRSLGEDSPRTAAVLVALAQLAERQGVLSEADQLLQRARRVQAQHLPEGHPEHVQSLNLLALIRFRQRRFEEALDAYRQALDILTRSPDTSEHALAVSAQNIAETLVELGRAGEALPHFERTLAAFEGKFGPGSPYVAFPLKGLGQAHLALGAHRQAIAALRRAHAIRVAHPGNTPELADVKWALARALAATGGRAEARTLAAEARELYLSLGEAGRPRAAELGRWLGAGE